MSKEYISLGLMSGTSGDGIDASLIQSDGVNRFKVIKDKFIKYNDKIYSSFHSLREKINNIKDLSNQFDSINQFERIITLLHVEVVSNFCKEYKIDLIGFHGQTIYHNAEEKISKQLGNGKLLSQSCRMNVVYNFRQLDLKNGGHGAPLAPIFHRLIAKKKKIRFPLCIINIGGISNATLITGESLDCLISQDIGPGNCMIDQWIRKNSDLSFDKNGSIARSGKVNQIILEQAQELFSNRSDSKKISLDTNDFDISFARGLSLEDGAATLTELTAQIISSKLIYFLKNISIVKKKILVSGGGRKNNFLIERINKKALDYFYIESIDQIGINGDFVESQAFGYLAIRSFLNLPISFPNTTGCKQPSSGGEVIKF